MRLADYVRGSFRRGTAGGSPGRISMCESLTEVEFYMKLWIFTIFSNVVKMERLRAEPLRVIPKDRVVVNRETDGVVFLRSLGQYGWQQKDVALPQGDSKTLAFPRRECC